MAEQATRNVPGDTDLWPSIQQHIEARHPSLARARRRGWAGEGLRLAAGAAVVAVLAVVLTLVFRFDPPSLDHPAVGNATPLPTPTVAVSTPTAAVTQPTATGEPAQPTATLAPVLPTPVRQIAPPEKRSAATTVAVGNLPINLAAGAGAVWVPSIGDRTVTRIDPETNGVVATIDIPAIAVAPSAIDRINLDDWGASAWALTVAASGL
jgi:hypothetical protein